MRLPVIEGQIERRLLVNYRVDPDVLEPLLPPPFRPQLVDGAGVAGICLIRLGDLRPRAFPEVRVACRAEDGSSRVDVSVRPTDRLRGSRLFADLAEASAFFDDSSVFPGGAAEFDHALLMRNVPVVWEPRPSLRSGAFAAA